MIPAITMHKKLLMIALLLNFQAIIADNNLSEDNIVSEQTTEDSTLDLPQNIPIVKKINKIFIVGNERIPEAAILNRIPYQVGGEFDPNQSGTLIRNLYNLGYFTKIDLKGEDVVDKINLHIFVEEKKLLDDVIFNGMSQIKLSDIKKKINFSEIISIDKEELYKYALILKKIYISKDYHLTEITPKLELKENDNNRAVAIFDITESPKNLIKRVFFEGNNHVSSKVLRHKVYTREDWVFGFMDKSGSYQRDAIEMDKHTIETFYQSNGYLTAKVVDVDVEMNKKTKQYNVIFYIEEGDIYKIKEVSAPGNDILDEQSLLERIPFKKDDLYSRELLKDSIEVLRVIWGEFGYIYADIEPVVEIDDKAKTVSVTFESELGDKVFLNKINIMGNKKTRDKIVRRQLILDEGKLITTRLMELSKNRLELLSYFKEQNGVNWRIERINQNLADLDLILDEIKTGRFNVKAGYGGTGDPKSPSASFNIGATVTETNLFGKGLRFIFDSNWSKEEKSLNFNFAEPWLLNKPIRAAIDLMFKKTQYDDFKDTKQPIDEQLIGGGLNFGFLLPTKSIFTPLFSDTTVLLNLRLENLEYNKVKEELAGTTDQKAEFQALLDRRFQSGYFFGLGGLLAQDRRNREIHPTRGYQWTLTSRFGLPMRSDFEFFNLEFDASWYTPLIGERDLILALHGHAGFIKQFKDKNVPYRELYHIGGPATVRGFKFGEIGPSWNGNSLGAKKAFYINTELIFPITRDFSMKGVLFYDGGAGWDTPDGDKIKSNMLYSDKFHYRHSIGFGIRLTQPTPVKIDVGFKLDKNKKLNESIKEIHFSAYRDF